MSKLAKYLKGSGRVILAVIVLLILQASCDLALPGYTSRIVTEGIQQKGVEGIIPERMQGQTFEDLKLFLDDEGIRLLEESYVPENEPAAPDGSSVYRLQKLPADQKETLAAALQNAEVLLYMFSHPEALSNMGLGSDSAAQPEDAVSDEATRNRPDRSRHCDRRSGGIRCEYGCCFRCSSRTLDRDPSAASLAPAQAYAGESAWPDRTDPGQHPEADRHCLCTE